MSAYVYTLVCTLQRLKGNVVLAFFKVGFITTGFELQCTFRFRLLFTEITIREYQIKNFRLKRFSRYLWCVFSCFLGPISPTFYAHFLYESNLHSFSLITDWLCDFLAKGYRQKMP